MSLDHPALQLAVTQIIGGTGPDPVNDRLQIRFARAAKGRLHLMQGARDLASTRIDSLPERRLSLPQPCKAATVPAAVVLDRTP